MVEVVVVRVGAATGGGAGRGTGPDQMAELAAGRIAVFGVGVVAAALGDRGERDVQFLQEVGERGGLPGVGSVAVSLAVCPAPLRVTTATG